MLEKVRVPLAEALIHVSEIMEAVEENDQEALEKIYNSTLDMAKEDFANAVDRRILADRALKAAIKMAEEAKREWNSRLNTIKKAHESLKQNTIFHIATNPGVKFAGKEGRIKIRKNGGKPLLKLNFETSEVKGLLSDQDIFKYEIPSECYQEMTVKVMNKDQMAEYIKKNSELELDHLNTPITTYLAKNKLGTLTRGSHMDVGGA